MKPTVDLNDPVMKEENGSMHRKRDGVSGRGWLVVGRWSFVVNGENNNWKALGSLEGLGLLVN